MFLFKVIHCSSLKDAFAGKSVHTKKAKSGGYLKVHVNRKGYGTFVETKSLSNDLWSIYSRAK